MKIQLQIITPEKTVFDQEIEEVTIPTKTGYLTILPHHVPLVSQIETGEITIKNGGRIQHIGILGGFLEVNKENINILADYAIRAEDIEVTKAEAAKKRAEKIMEEKNSNKDFVEAEAQLRRSLLDLRVARRRTNR